MANKEKRPMIPRRLCIDCVEFYLCKVDKEAGQYTYRAGDANLIVTDEELALVRGGGNAIGGNYGE